MNVLIDASPGEYLNFLHSEHYIPGSWTTPLCAWVRHMMLERIEERYFDDVFPCDYGTVCVGFRPYEGETFGVQLTMYLPEWTRPLYLYYEKLRKSTNGVVTISRDESIHDLFSLHAPVKD